MAAAEQGVDPITELIGFLADPKVAVRREAASCVSGLTGSVEGMAILIQQAQSLFPQLLRRLHDEDQQVKSHVYATLVNLSLDEGACEALLSLGVIPRIVEILREHKNQDAGEPGSNNLKLTAQLLSNLTLKVSAVEELLQKGKGPMEGFFVSWVVQTMVATRSAEEEEDRDHFAAVLTNVSQDSFGRSILLGSNGAHLKWINQEFTRSCRPLRQESLARVIRNVCMGCQEDGSVASILESGTVAAIVHVLSDRIARSAAKEKNPAGPSSQEGEFTPAALHAVVEAVLCLALDDQGRERLWNQKVPDILQKIYENETDEQLCSALERCADVFISESNGVDEPPGTIEEIATE